MPSGRIIARSPTTRVHQYSDRSIVKRRHERKAVRSQRAPVEAKLTGMAGVAGSSRKEVETEPILDWFFGVFKFAPQLCQLAPGRRRAHADCFEDNEGEGWLGRKKGGGVFSFCSPQLVSYKLRGSIIEQCCESETLT